MRIIGEIPHEIYKMTVLKMNNKVTLQIEDRLLTQSYTFRDGSGIDGLNDIQEILSTTFMKNVEIRFNEMMGDYLDLLEKNQEEDSIGFEII